MHPAKTQMLGNVPSKGNLKTNSGVYPPKTQMHRERYFVCFRDRSDPKTNWPISATYPQLQAMAMAFIPIDENPAIAIPSRAVQELHSIHFDASVQEAAKSQHLDMKWFTLCATCKRKSNCASKIKHRTITKECRKKLSN